MNSLLGSADDPRTAGLLGLGLRLMSTPGRFGQAFGSAGLGALGDMRQAQAAQDQRRRAGLQEQMMLMQLEQAKQAAERKAKDDAVLAESFKPLQGPMPDGAAGVTPRFDLPGMMSRGLSMDGVPEALKLNAALNPPRKLRDVAAGASVIDEANPTVPLYTAPKESAPTELSRLIAERDKLPLGHPARAVYDAAIKKSTTHAPAPSASVTMVQDKEENKAVGKFYGEQFADLQKSGLSAQGRVDRLSRMEGLLERINTGKFEGVKKEAAAVAQSLGFTLDPNLSDKEAFEALSNQLALEARSTAEGGGMPGAMSDKDREFLVQITPNLTKTAEGNRTIIQTSKKLAQRQREVAAKAREYRMRKGTLDERFFEELQAWSDQNPLFAGSVSAPAQAPGLSAAEKAELEQLRARFNRGK